MNTVRGKTAIVTGGAKNIGFQCCRQLILNGAKAVAILDLPNSNGESSAKILNTEIGEERVFFFPSDVTKFDEFEGVLKEAARTLQGLDILVNNAGIMDDRNWQKMININFMGVVNSSLVGYDCMGKHKGGKGGMIVNVASVAALVQAESFPIYAATKHAVVGFTVSLKGSYEATGVSVRVICPGTTATPLITECNNKCLNFINNDAVVGFVTSIRSQPAEHVGKALIEVIEKGENGSVWVTQFSQPPFQIELPKYQNITY